MRCCSSRGRSPFRVPDGSPLLGERPSWPFSLVIVPLVDLVSQKLRPVHVEDMFSAYNERRTVDITDNLGK